MMTGWRAYGMLAFHLHNWNQLKVIRLASRLRTRNDFLTFLDIGGSAALLCSAADLMSQCHSHGGASNL